MKFAKFDLPILFYLLHNRFGALCYFVGAIGPFGPSMHELLMFETSPLPTYFASFNTGAETWPFSECLNSLVV